uniref:Uncharacterized protein n=1 Tax=Romanomermis culicivorax TaxID=13658 RepID=A0A915K852_ROMCU
MPQRFGTFVPGGRRQLRSGGRHNAHAAGRRQIHDDHRLGPGVGRPRRQKRLRLPAPAVAGTHVRH